MPLNSSSTQAEIIAAYADNASWEEDGDVTKARRFVTACRMLLLKLPKSSARGSESLTMSPDLIRQEMDRARAFVQAHDTSARSKSQSVIHPSFRNFRD